MDMNWLSDLEEKVHAVSQQLEALRKESRSFKSKMQKLRRELAEARADGGNRDWERQREEVRRRVSRLAERLEKLV
ncbi:MAG: hypothetical protein V3T81_07330 [Thermoanaerobaculia bacterium]